MTTAISLPTDLVRDAEETAGAEGKSPGAVVQEALRAARARDSAARSRHGATVAKLTLGATLDNLSMTNIKLPVPVFHGDILPAETEILDKKESRSKSDHGVVLFAHGVFNRRGEEVACCKPPGVMMQRPAWVPAGGSAGRVR